MFLLPNYIHIVKPSLRHTYLSFDEEGNLIIKSPEVSQHFIETLLLNKAEWIRKSREKLAQKKGRYPDYTASSLLYYKGIAYPFRVVLHNTKNSSFSFEENRFFLYTHTMDTLLLQKQIDLFYKKEAEKFLPQLVEKYAQQMQLFPKEIHFRKTRRQWGSCSGSNRLSLNTMLMKLPEELIGYVIVHELAHIRYKHHQKSFWKLVEQYMPLYKKHIRELHTYTT